MKRIFIIHGWDGSSKGDWMPWVTDELRKSGYQVFCPDMPHTKWPTIWHWVSTLSKIVGTPDENTYFIGHSIGCQTIMRYLEKSDVRVGGAIFVAGWFDLKNVTGFWEKIIIRPWIKNLIDTKKVRNSLIKSIAILGDNDQWVPYEETKLVFKNDIGSEVVTLSGGGHITSDDGFVSFPQIIDIVKREF